MQEMLEVIKYFTMKNVSFPTLVRIFSRNVHLPMLDGHCHPHSKFKVDLFNVKIALKFQNYLWMFSNKFQEIFFSK